jgi:protein SCO1/2
MQNLNVRSIYVLAAAVVLALACSPIRAQLSPPDKVNTALVSLDQKLDTQVPADAKFFDETGKAVTMGDYFGKKPVLLCMIFYKCPGVCMKELEGLMKLFNDPEMSLKPGKDFEAVVVSINPKENPEQAASKKREFASLLKHPEIASGWHFLTGAQEDIKKVADTVGFRYTADILSERFVHPAGLILLTPQGRTSKYLYGAAWPARDARLALVDASGSKIGSLSDRILITCVFQWDMKSGRYGVAIMRVLQVSAVLTVLILGTSIVLMSRRSRDGMAVASSQPAQPAQPGLDSE